VLHQHLLRPERLAPGVSGINVLSDLGHVIEILCLLRGLLLYRDEAPTAATALEIRPQRVIYVFGRHLSHLEVPQVLLPQREGVAR
jgi:hypothetical protein